jgi:hypothetical protein
MAEITLADYTGYIFLEIIRAREMADRHSRALAEVYARDPVLQHFSVPRFKVPKLELTIPVLISGARFSQVLTFKMPREKFEAYVTGRIREVVSRVRSDQVDFERVRADPIIRPEVRRGARASKRAPARAAARAAEERAPSVAELTTQFYQALVANPDPSQPGNVVREYWTAIFQQGLTEAKLLDVWKESDPKRELFRKSLEDVLTTVTTNTVVDSTAIQSLLINPETNVVKNGSNDASVFTIRADMLEEGFFLKEITDEDGKKRPIVEFE